MLAVQVAGLAQIATIVLLVGGEGVFNLIGVHPVPDWYKTVAENKMLTFGAVWMANNVAAQLVATGAFEIEVNGLLVFSKLEKGRLPNLHDIHNGLQQLGLEPLGKAGSAAAAQSAVRHQPPPPPPQPAGDDEFAL